MPVNKHLNRLNNLIRYEVKAIKNNEKYNVEVFDTERSFLEGLKHARSVFKLEKHKDKKR